MFANDKFLGLPAMRLSLPSRESVRRVGCTSPVLAFFFGGEREIAGEITNAPPFLQLTNLPIICNATDLKMKGGLNRTWTRCGTLLSLPNVDR